MAKDPVTGDALMTMEERTALAHVNQCVVQEIGLAIRKFGPDYASAHEAFGVLLEEVDEFKALVWQKRENRSKRAMIGELVQVAAVAQKFAAQLEREIVAAGGPK